jgi:hemerythrin
MNESTLGVAWNDAYSLGNEEIDRQHKMLFSLVNQLAVACMDGTDKERLSKTLSFLGEYTEQHFSFEETLQIFAKYPDYARHKKLHDDFVGTVGELVERFDKNGSSAELSSDVNKIVVKWLIHHIKKEDMKVGDFIREQETQVKNRPVSSPRESA